MLKAIYKAVSIMIQRGKENSPAPLKLIDVVREYFNKYEVENDLSENTIRNYKGFLGNITLFLHETKQYNMTINEVSPKLTDGFKYWLHKTKPTCCVSHCSRHLEVFKRVTKYAVTMEYIQADPLSPVKTGRDKPKPVIYLEIAEIKKLINSQFDNNIYNHVRDLFLFQCYTGLSYADIYSYEMIEKNGKLWLTGQRQKTQKSNDVYVFPEAYRIYLKYSGNLPVIANQTYNRALKEIANILRIKKKLTTHIGRKTHAMLLLKHGVGTKPISIQLGNTEDIVNRHYVDESLTILESAIDKAGLNKNLKLVS